MQAYVKKKNKNHFSSLQINSQNKTINGSEYTQIEVTIMSSNQKNYKKRTL